MAIWQDLVDQHGYSGGYQTVKRFVRKLRGAHSPQAVGIILTAPGEEAQVDYGTGPMVRDQKSGKYRRTRLFVMTLGYSRKSVRLLVFRSSSQTWAELHEKAFRRLGGSPRVVVLDNLREGVLTPTSTIPRSIRSTAMCCPTTAWWPCRAGSEIRIEKVKSNPASAMRRKHHSRVSASRAWRRPKPISITGRNTGPIPASTAPPNDKWQSCSPRKSRSCSRCRSNLSLLPVRRAGGASGRLCRSRARLLRPPPGWIGRQVQVQWDALHVRILDPRNYQLLREHLRQFPGNYRINEEDRSNKTPLSAPCNCWPAPPRPAPTSASSAQAIHRNEAELGMRRILGVLSLAKRYGVAAVDDACAAALDLGWRTTALCAAIWNATPSSRCAMSIR